jgi:hypothetical protein
LTSPFQNANRKLFSSAFIRFHVLSILKHQPNHKKFMTMLVVCRPKEVAPLHVPVTGVLTITAVGETPLSSSNATGMAMGSPSGPGLTTSHSKPDLNPSEVHVNPFKQFIESMGDNPVSFNVLFILKELFHGLILSSARNRKRLVRRMLDIVSNEMLFRKLSC